MFLCMPRLDIQDIHSIHNDQKIVPNTYVKIMNSIKKILTMFILSFSGDADVIRMRALLDDAVNNIDIIPKPVSFI